jgi:hypothetical protein
MTSPINLLVLYDPRSTHINTVYEHLHAFGRYSRHRVCFSAATDAGVEAPDLSPFDAVVVHYSVRICVEKHLSPAFRGALAAFGGLKVLFIQDEYDTTETARRAIEALGFQVVHTCVPPADIGKVYPPERFPGTEFVPTLTGYVPSGAEGWPVPPVSGRPLLIGYRGRALPYWYGDLGREKLTIGVRMREICDARRLPVDIEWENDRRIYGDDWLPFLRRCKATLGTESGSNLFDDLGDVRRAVEAALQQDPGARYEDLRPTLLAPHDNRIRMNQISPKIFEAVACGTALVLFEGEYSGIVRPDVHFIPLRKDFSNVDEVLGKLGDDRRLEEMTARAHRDVIGSGRYGYPAFVEAFDRLIDARVARKGSPFLITEVIGGRPEGARQGDASTFFPAGRAHMTNAPLLPEEYGILHPPAPPDPPTLQVQAARALSPAWMLVPERIRHAVRGPLRRLFGMPGGD